MLPTLLCILAIATDLQYVLTVPAFDIKLLSLLLFITWMPIFIFFYISYKNARDHTTNMKDFLNHLSKSFILYCTGNIDLFTNKKESDCDPLLEKYKNGIFIALI